MTKRYDSDSSLREKILEGVDILADNVASTLGPRGRNVILQSAGKKPIITKDGVTVAEFVELEDPFMNAGVQILKQASRETNTTAGDGTTTATVLARAILQSASRQVVGGASPIELKRGIDKATEVLVESLEKQARPIQSIDDITHIATISANNEESIGKLVAKAVDCVGKDGAITVEEARSLHTSLDLMEGFRFDSGYVSPSFINVERKRSVAYEDPFILVVGDKIDKVDDILHVLEFVARESKPLVIIASDIEGQALAALIMNTVRGTMKIAAVKAPRYGEERRNILKDLCISTGSTFLTKSGDVKLQDAKLENLGTCKKIEITKGFTTIVDGRSDPDEVEKKIEDLKAELGELDNTYAAERIQERITRLASGVAIIRVGAATEAEMIEKRHRVEDALEAVKAAQKEGIVPGGGVALLNAIENFSCEADSPDQHAGIQCVVSAARAPIRQMASNAGVSPDIVENIVQAQKDGVGYNFASGETCNMFEHGIIDPLLVTKTALQNAASAAGILITTGHAIIQEKK